MMNCFSKFPCAVPLKTKISSEMVKALLPILSVNKMKPFQADKGIEFYNATVQSLLN